MRTEILQVTGMTCDSCITKVTEALKTIPGVGDVNVSLSTGAVTIQFDERQASPEQLKRVIQQAGYGLEGAETTQKNSGKGCCCS